MTSATLQHEIQMQLAEREPLVEVLLVEVVGGSTARVFIDHPEGVTLEVCTSVTNALAEVRERYALEVSSPGTERPLCTADHFRRFMGRRARVRTREARDGHSSFTGQIVGASDSEVTIAADSGVIAISYDEINRSNLVEE